MMAIRTDPPGTAPAAPPIGRPRRDRSPRRGDDRLPRRQWPWVLAAFLVLVLLVARRMGLSARTTPPVPQTTDQTADQTTDQSAEQNVGGPPGWHPSAGANRPPG